MCPMVRDAVKRQMERSLKKGTKYLFFNSHGNPLCTANFSRTVWVPLMKMLDIKYRTFEQTRHTYASLSLANDGRISYVSKQMGHKNVYITLTIYAKFIPNEDDGKVMEKVTDHIQTCISLDNTEDCNDLDSQVI